MDREASQNDPQILFHIYFNLVSQNTDSVLGELHKFFYKRLVIEFLPV